MKRIAIILLLFSLISCKNEGNKKRLCECHPNKYTKILHKLYDFDCFFDIKEAIACSKHCKKPILIRFSSHAENTHPMEIMIKDNNFLYNTIKDKFIMLILYVDDITKVNKEEWLITKENDTLKTMGKINYYRQIDFINYNAQPCFIVINEIFEKLSNFIGYTRDKDKFEEFITNSLENY
jgi:hypothetical protein